MFTQRAIHCVGACGRQGQQSQHCLWHRLIGVIGYLYSVDVGNYWQRKRNSETSDKYLANTYPALFGAKKLSFPDFLNPIYLTEDAFHRASVQKAQVLLFSFLVGWLLLSLVLRIGTLEDLSLTVVGLMGISGIGAATSHVTYQQKTRLSFVNWAWLQKNKVIKKPNDEDWPRPEWKDLVMAPA